MATRKHTTTPEYPPALAALIERWQQKPPPAVAMLDTLAAEPSLQEWLVPDDTKPDQDAWNAEFKAFYGWAATDLAKPIPMVPHLIQAKRQSTKADFANTPKGQSRKGTRKGSRTATSEQIDAYCDDLLAMPEHANCGWTFALRLMRILGSGSNFPEFRERFHAAQERAGVTSKRARKPVEPAAEPEPQPDPEPPKRARRAKKAAA